MDEPAGEQDRADEVADAFDSAPAVPERHERYFHGLERHRRVAHAAIASRRHVGVRRERSKAGSKNSLGYLSRNFSQNH